MTNEELFDLILKKARRAGDTNLRSNIEDEIRQFIQKIERSPFHPWFLEKTSSGLVTVANIQTISMPSDYLLQVEDTDFFLINDDNEYCRLDRGYHEDIENQFGGQESDIPGSYDFFGDLIYFGPIPDDEYTAQFKYYQKTTLPEDNSNDVDNLWVLNAEDFFVTSIAFRLVDNYIKDDKRARSLKGEANEARIELHKYNESRKHVNMNYKVNR